MKSNNYSGGSYGSINEPTAVNMKHDDNDEDFWAWGETSSKSQGTNGDNVSNNEPETVHKNSGSNLRKQSSSDFDESWGWDDEFAAAKPAEAKTMNGKKSPNLKTKKETNTNGWNDDGNDDWGNADSWSNEDWSSVPTRKTISAGNGKKAV